MAASIDQKIKANLIRFRISRNLSQTDMADRLGLSRNAYRNIEVGDTRLVHKEVENIAKFFDVSMEALILGYEPMDIDSDPRLLKFKKNYSLSRKLERELNQKEIDRLLAENFNLKQRIELLKELLESKDNLIAFMKKEKNQD